MSEYNRDLQRFGRTNRIPQTASLSTLQPLWTRHSSRWTSSNLTSLTACLNRQHSRKWRDFNTAASECGIVFKITARQAAVPTDCTDGFTPEFYFGDGHSPSSHDHTSPSFSRFEEARFLLFPRNFICCMGLIAGSGTSASRFPSRPRLRRRRIRLDTVVE